MVECQDLRPFDIAEQGHKAETLKVLMDVKGSVWAFFLSNASVLPAGRA